MESLDGNEITQRGVYERIADICIDSKNDVIVNWIQGISYDGISEILNKAILSVERCKEKAKVMREIEQMQMRETNTPR